MLELLYHNRQWQLQSSMALTSGALGVLLDMLAFLDELVLGRGAGKTTLGRGAQLRSEARYVAGGYSRGKHGDGGCRRLIAECKFGIRSSEIKLG